MKRIKVQPAPECERCDDERKYEVVYPGTDGEPRYYIQDCECTLSPFSQGEIDINRTSPLHEIKKMLAVMETINATSNLKMKWGKGRIISLTLPSSFMAF